MTITILNRYSGGEIFTSEVGTIKEAVENANLRNANLCNADLRNADLRNANLCGANLCDADLRNANLCGANLCDANLRGANLCNADLRNADLRNANLCGANLRNADLRNANLCGADLRDANLRGANLCGLTLTNNPIVYYGLSPYWVMVVTGEDENRIKCGCLDWTWEEFRSLTHRDLLSADGETAVKWHPVLVKMLAVVEAVFAEQDKERATQ